MARIREWLECIDYRVLTGTDEAQVSSFSADSRKATEGSAFLCMKGSVVDSHDLIADTYEKGVRVFIVERELGDLNLPKDSNNSITVIRVDNSRVAMACLSSAFFDHPSRKMKMIGITGTKGKTSTSYIIKKIIEENGYKVGVIGTNGCVIDGVHYDTKNTTPDSFELNKRFQEMVKAGCDYCVMECSSQGFKMHRTDGIVFDYGIFLNISPDHIGPLEHADFKEYLDCKSCLLKQSKTVVLNASDENAEEILISAGVKNERLILFTARNENRVGIELAKEHAGEINRLNSDNYEYLRSSEFTGTGFSVSGMKEASFRLAMPGDYNILNALSAIAFAFSEGFDKDTTDKALRGVSVTGRTEIILKNDKYTVIVDYAHNEISMVTLMDTLANYEHKRLVTVFGCGGNRSKDRRTGMGAAAAHASDFCVFTSDNSRDEKPENIIHDIEVAYLAAGGSKDSYVCIPDRREAIYYAIKNAEDGDIIAVIGKGHEDYQEENGIRKHFLDSEEILKAKERIDNENQSK